MTAGEWQRGEYHGRGARCLLFDDLDQTMRLLSSVPVLAATWTAD
jgi:hypothetical protein